MLSITCYSSENLKLLKKNDFIFIPERIKCYLESFWGHIDSFKDYLIFLMCICVCLLVYMCTTCVQHLLRPDEAIGSPGTGVTRGCEPPDVCVENELGFFPRPSRTLNHSAISSALILVYNYNIIFCFRPLHFSVDIYIYSFFFCVGGLFCFSKQGFFV